ncbi:hypothetical protein CYMTET_29094 [Cymbomonas tetramitiformis]|uniref:Uncharacterized protein n=1 Tax=Cymbomonas tetramitiformis TaxID=36881 RepID=A0AAE0FLP9_9CHLO|nr:hypothetical protein CYMTET_29094 [Cymbomonas tetramitiformis]
MIFHGYATITDDEDVSPPQPPLRPGCGRPIPGFGRSLLNSSMVCALFAICATAAPLTAAGFGGAGEGTCTAPPIGGAATAGLPIGSVGPSLTSTSPSIDDHTALPGQLVGNIGYASDSFYDPADFICNHYFNIDGLVIFFDSRT